MKTGEEWKPGNSIEPLRMWKWKQQDVERVGKITMEEAVELNQRWEAVKWMHPSMAKAMLDAKGVQGWEQIAVLRLAGLKIESESDASEMSGLRAIPERGVLVEWNEVCVRRASMWLVGGSLKKIAALEGVKPPTVFESIERVLPQPRRKVRASATVGELGEYQRWFQGNVEALRGSSPTHVASSMLFAVEPALVEDRMEQLGDYASESGDVDVEEEMEEAYTNEGDD